MDKANQFTADKARAGGETPLSGLVTERVHRLLARVYHADTDFSGVVYHGRYVEFLERGRTDYLRLIGIHHSALAEGLHGEELLWIVRRMELDFCAPARIDDILTIETAIENISGARIHMRQRIMRDDTLLIEAKVEAALINMDGRPRRFPKEWKDILQPIAKILTHP
ncbi:tol-pal system-associated acyl-CoA thioesterase [Brucella endophytica]|uniref:Tol-pal system-associated acyl-CoA thioesterase n=1 Tax=Brucella endophytica TaxID=1963359 RepID=A0A916WGQ9_9HYPH|nr:tol-pal system-associated acyl-CoA thioesterase [Brucella endophytica]GGA95976.1 tol-pal system-associated acyl-CoA thioesterase [Brucella endophytica]